MITALLLFVIFILMCMSGYVGITLLIGVCQWRKFDSLEASVDHARSWPRRLFGFEGD